MEWGLSMTSQNLLNYWLLTHTTAERWGFEVSPFFIADLLFLFLFLFYSFNIKEWVSDRRVDLLFLFGRINLGSVEGNG